ncbi:ParA family protein [filamentous cyanobacterium LEGE 11480]|uniref:ParA family protein n=1 Tax=Romeriopsis navalis LEGE 11480 TaxID=2777977 RepID=A0A928Z3S8_9CYAN|nr:ParA family protein [Romeriopsis navalis]MBE9031816.1 ParA family protein [Romeriopsis navalis LEGE 11480]
MIITIASTKGGAAKSTSAANIAFAMTRKRGAAPIAIVDMDRNRTIKNWSERSDDELPFYVFAEDEFPADWEGDVILDTPGNVDIDELLELAEQSDLVVLPTLPAAFSLESTIATLTQVEALTNYRILLTNVPPRPNKAGIRAMAALDDVGLLRFKKSVARRVVYMESELVGLPVGMMPGTGAKSAANDYKSVTAELVKVVKNG